jgi:Sulfatase-modifying factor enzyme 1
VNYNGEYPYAGGKKGLYRGKTVPVKSLSPNPWGLFEMHGNVWEWCNDWFVGDYPTESVVDPDGPPSGANRVLRGGSWLYYGRSVRSAARDGGGPDDRGDDVGFRLSLGQVVFTRQVTSRREGASEVGADRRSGSEVGQRLRRERPGETEQSKDKSFLNRLKDWLKPK